MMRHVNPVATAAWLGAAALAACTNAGSPILIVQNQVPGDGCVVDSTVGTDFNPRGRIDVNAGAGYLFTPVVQNFAEERDSLAQSIAIIEGADIELTLQEGFPAPTDSLLTKFSKRFSGAVQPGGGTTSFAFTIIPEQLLEEMAANLADDGSQLVEVQADISIFGTMGGGDISTPTFTYWVDVCNGCMKQNVGACADLSDSFEPLEGGPCVTLQDVVLECCTAADSTEVCPAAAPAE